MMKLMNLKKELVLKIEYGEVLESPREWGNLGTFYTWERGYITPDNNDYRNGMEFFEDMLGYDLAWKIHDKYNNVRDFMVDVAERMNKLGYVLFPVAKHEHGNIIYELGTASGWDSGTVGVIFAKKEKIYEWFNVKKVTGKVLEQVERNFESELDTYTKYVNGEVYGYIVEDLIENEVDSVWGFYEDMYDEKTALKVVSEHYDIGSLEDWVEYDEEKIDELFEVETVITRR